MRPIFQSRALESAPRAIGKMTRLSSNLVELFDVTFSVIQDVDESSSLVLVETTATEAACKATVASSLDESTTGKVVCTYKGHDLSTRGFNE
jgi:hypothetical protein